MLIAEDPRIPIGHHPLQYRLEKSDRQPKTRLIKQAHRNMIRTIGEEIKPELSDR
jgi:hypothetical protein